jgi:hypothetical protein
MQQCRELRFTAASSGFSLGAAVSFLLPKLFLLFVFCGIVIISRVWYVILFHACTFMLRVVRRSCAYMRVWRKSTWRTGSFGVSRPTINGWFTYRSAALRAHHLQLLLLQVRPQQVAVHWVWTCDIRSRLMWSKSEGRMCCCWVASLEVCNAHYHTHIYARTNAFSKAHKMSQCAM